MLSTKTLEYLGISDPQIGMEVELDFYWNDVFHTEGNRTSEIHPFRIFYRISESRGKFLRCISVGTKTN